MHVAAVRWGHLLTHHIADSHGLPRYGVGGEPVTITVAVWGSGASRIPVGPTISLEGAIIPPRSESSVALEKVIDHVHGWTGMTDHGRSLPCTRNAVKAMCLADDGFWRELKHAIRLANTMGER